MKKAISFLLALALIAVAVSALAATSSITVNNLAAGSVSGSAQSPTMSVALNNLNQVTGVTVTTAQSPTMSVTLNNLNQVTNVVTNSPTMSVTLNNLNQVTGTVLSPTMSMTLNNLNQVTSTSLSPSLSIALNTLNRYAVTGGNGMQLTGLFTIQDVLTADAQSAFNAIAAYVGKGQAAIGYFNMDMMDLILSGALSSDYLGFDFSSLILSEYVSLGINNYLGNSVDVTATFGFASEYRQGQTVVAMFGYPDENGNIVWNALNTVTTNGQVKVDIPSELLLNAGSEAILGILS